MSRKKTNKIIERMIEEPKKKTKKKEIKKPEIVEEKIGFEKALKEFKRKNLYKAHLMEKQIVQIFVKKQIPEMVATQKEFNRIFKKF